MPYYNHPIPSEKGGMAMDYVLQTDSLTKTYKTTKALDRLTMNVERGAIYGFVGRNGAGKTTLIRLICGLQLPTEGSFTLYGCPNTGREITKARRRMGAVVETPSIYLSMTAEENLKQQYQILGLPSCEGVGELLELVRLQNTGRKKARDFSLGMRQRLGIAVALAGDPDFLILDEPANGLDPQGIVEIRELILRLNRERQITVLISSHILDELSRLATHYGFIDGGRMVRGSVPRTWRPAAASACASPSATPGPSPPPWTKWAWSTPSAAIRRRTSTAPPPSPS